MHSAAEICSVHYNQKKASLLLAHSLSEHILSLEGERQFILLCIGTDRSTGDSLGPLVGTHLQRLRPKGLHVYGSLDEPVHALNLESTMAKISENHPSPYIIAVDACLGQTRQVGQISLRTGSLKPGAGVHKKLPEVGDMAVTCVVNTGGFMEYLVLQSTRLAHVFRMAQVVAQGLFLAFEHVDMMHHRKKRSLSQQPLLSAWRPFNFFDSRPIG